MDETDTLDKNKSRGFLIGYSSILLALYYFNADLSTIKLLGNEIKLQNNIKSIWLVLAFINAYLILRYVQRLPTNWWRFDNEMQEKCDEWIKVICKIRHKRKISEKLTYLIKKRHNHAFNFDTSTVNITDTKPYPNFVPCTEEFNGNSVIKFSTETRNHNIKNQERFVLIQQIRANYQVEGNGKQGTFTEDYKIQTIANKPMKACITMLTILTGAIYKPWFCDIVAPIIMGLFSTAFSMLKWAQTNSYFNIFG